DCVAVPSAWETWGLIVNEALAVGTPCVVSDGVASGPDLIRNGISGSTHAVGDVAGLADSLVRVRNGRRNGIITAESCRAMARTHSFDRATEGLVEATRRVTARRQVTISSNSGAPRVLATFGNMAIISGVERMSFEVLRTIRHRRGAVHCVVNEWGSAKIV